MRVRSLQELSALPMHDHFKRQLEAELRATPPRSNQPVQRGEKRSDSTNKSPPTAGTALALQDQLAKLVEADDELRAHAWVRDYAKAVPGRKFEIDLSLPRWCLGIELDGWLWHAKRKKDFLRDREKDYLLSLAGWQVYRLQAGLVYKDVPEAMRRIKTFIATWLPRQQMLIEHRHILPPPGSDYHNKDDDPS